jgi:Raf kinase inhibitor-like YbhB/YbcL family protein
MTFALTSPAFGDGQPVPPRYTQDGQNLSPPLEWSDPPPQAKSFVLVVEDPDAPSGTFRHWGLYNIGRGRDRLPEGVGHGVPTEDLGTAVNDFGHPHYDGPAPPQGDKPHRYVFRLAAVDVDGISQAPNLSVAEAWEAAQAHILAQAELTGVYARR